MLPNKVLDFEIGCPECGSLDVVLARDEGNRELSDCYMECLNCGNKYK